MKGRGRDLETTSEANNTDDDQDDDKNYDNDFADASDEASEGVHRPTNDSFEDDGVVTCAGEPPSKSKLNRHDKPANLHEDDRRDAAADCPQTASRLARPASPSPQTLSDGLHARKLLISAAELSSSRPQPDSLPLARSSNWPDVSADHRYHSLPLESAAASSRHRGIASGEVADHLVSSAHSGQGLRDLQSSLVTKHYDID